MSRVHDPDANPGKGSLDPPSKALLGYRERLQAEADKDRAAREQEHIDDQQIGRLEAEAAPLIDEIFQAYGWPRISLFGAQAAANFWLLVQHQEPNKQRRMLPSLQAAVAAGDASASAYAYLFDRLQVASGKAQHWGTQSRCVHHHAVLYTLDASATEVNTRRKLIGIPMLGEDDSESICKRASD